MGTLFMLMVVVISHLSSHLTLEKRGLYFSDNLFRPPTCAFSFPCSCYDFVYVSCPDCGNGYGYESVYGFSFPCLCPCLCPYPCPGLCPFPVLSCDSDASLPRPFPGAALLVPFLLPYGVLVRFSVIKD